MTDTETKSELVKLLESNEEKYQDPAAVEAYLAEVREEAAGHFLDLLLTSEVAQKSLFDKIDHRDRCRNKTAKIEQWQGPGPVYKDQSLSDLLDRGDLLQRMQDFLDLTHGAGQFRIFNHPVRRTRMVALVVSWNKEGFENIDSIIERNRQKAQERYERRESRRRGDDEEDDDEEHQQHDDRYQRQSGGGRRYEDNRGPRRYEDRPSRRDNYHDDRSDRPPRRSYRGDGPPRDNRYSDGPRRRGPPQGDRPVRRDRDGPRDAPRDGPSRRHAAVANYDN